jgi:ABC transporter substrate binding protein
MNRREFITLLGGTAAWPLAARAQQPERMRRVGFLRAAPPSERELEGLLRGLVDHGWVQGRNFVLLPQWGDGNVARLPELAVALMNTNVDIIVADGVVTARAARAVTATIPIVMTASADPFVGGFVQSLARPGGNVTGLSTMAARLFRPRRAEGYAPRNRRAAQRGDQCWPRRFHAEGAACGPRGNDACRLACRFRQAHRRRDREMGKGDQVRRHQAAVRLLQRLDIP